MIKKNKAINQFYESSNDEIRKPAEHWLHELQKQPYAWRLPSQLLNSSVSNSIVFYNKILYKLEINNISIFINLFIFIKNVYIKINY